MKAFLLLLPLFILLIGCQKIQKDTGYTVFWIHIEGAPIRTFFDHWLDPHGLFKVERPEAEFKEANFHGVKTFFPEVWFQKDNPSALLDHWVNIRGIETSSPHLKEARKEWIYPIGSWKKDLSITVANQRLKKIYETLLEENREISTLDPKLKQGSEFPFTQWIKKLDKKEVKKPQVHLFIMDGEKNFKLENQTNLNEKSLSNYQAFYQNLISSLESFVENLKRRELFNKSVIIITSDRSRIVTNSKPPFETTTLWQGLNFSLLSGAVSGPLNLGHIQRTHPLYSDSLPGTWGLALDAHGVESIHLLIKELVDAPMFIRPKGKRAKNPWINPKILQKLGVKQNPGRVF